jgi:hypothetical protein
LVIVIFNQKLQAVIILKPELIAAMLAGTLSDAPSFTDERIDAECMLCGTPTVVDYSDGVLVQRCPSSDGVTQEPTEPPGVIAKEYRPPVGLRNRTPQEFVQHGKTWQRHQRHAFIEKTCPNCSGTITTTIHICADHDSHDLTVCDHCDRVHEIVASFVCDVCKSSMRTGIWTTILTDVAAITFLIEKVAVHTEDPLEIVVRVELEGDRLDVTLDDEVNLIDVTERLGKPA